MKYIIVSSTDDINWVKEKDLKSSSMDEALFEAESYINENEADKYLEVVGEDYFNKFGIPYL